jgi:hypothetical protein
MSSLIIVSTGQEEHMPQVTAPTTFCSKSYVCIPFSRPTLTHYKASTSKDVTKYTQKLSSKHRAKQGKEGNGRKS